MPHYQVKLIWVLDDGNESCKAVFDHDAPHEEVNARFAELVQEYGAEYVKILNVTFPEKMIVDLFKEERLEIRQ